MLPKPIPALTEKQWAFIEDRLEKPIPEAVQRRLQESLENAKKISVE